MASGPIQHFLEQDHERLDVLLARSLDSNASINENAFDEFRKGLLKHIGIEEKLIFVFVARSNALEHQAIARTLRLHHGALASLLALRPSPALISAIRTILSIHNPIEEGPHQFYEICESLMGDQASDSLARIVAAPEVPVATRKQTSQLLEAAKRSLVRAGFSDDLLSAHELRE